MTSPIVKDIKRLANNAGRQTVLDALEEALAAHQKWVDEAFISALIKRLCNIKFPREVWEHPDEKFAEDLYRRNFQAGATSPFIPLLKQLLLSHTGRLVLDAALIEGVRHRVTKEQPPQRYAKDRRTKRQPRHAHNGIQ
jgi:hypothetical protein